MCCYLDNIIYPIQNLSQSELIKYINDEYILAIYGYNQIEQFFNLIKDIFEQIDLVKNNLVLYFIINQINHLFEIILKCGNANLYLNKFKHIDIESKIIKLSKNIITTHPFYMEMILDQIFIFETINIQNNDFIQLAYKIYKNQMNQVQINKDNFNFFYMGESIFKIILKYYQNDKFDKGFDTEFEHIINILKTCTNVHIITNIITSLSYLNDKNFYIIFNEFENIIKSQDYVLFFSSISKNIDKQEYIINYWINNSEKLNCPNEIKLKILQAIVYNTYNPILVNVLFDYIKLIYNNKNKLILDKIYDILESNIITYNNFK